MGGAQDDESLEVNDVFCQEHQIVGEGQSRQHPGVGQSLAEKLERESQPRVNQPSLQPQYI